MKIEGLWEEGRVITGSLDFLSYPAKNTHKEKSVLRYPVGIPEIQE